MNLYVRVGGYKSATIIAVRVRHQEKYAIGFRIMQNSACQNFALRAVLEDRNVTFPSCHISRYNFACQNSTVSISRCTSLVHCNLWVEFTGVGGRTL